MAAIITKALIEIFVRATGWEQDEHRSAAGTWSANRGDTLHVVTLNDVHVAMIFLVKADGEDVRERLGLCAAAEDRFLVRDAYRKIAAGTPDALKKRDVIAMAVAADDAATRFLEMVGISRERWDAARKGEGR